MPFSVCGSQCREWSEESLAPKKTFFTLVFHEKSLWNDECFRERALRPIWCDLGRAGTQASMACAPSVQLLDIYLLHRTYMK